MSILETLLMILAFNINIVLLN